MTITLPSNAVLYSALIARDPAYDGVVFVGVTRTGVFCRSTCAARKPKQENTVFFDSAEACMRAGFRACKRCRPLAPGNEPDPVVKALLALLEQNPRKRWREQDLPSLGFDPSTVRRAFSRRFGQSFLSLARQQRLANAKAQLNQGSSVIEAQLEAGFNSGSGFCSALVKRFGTLIAVADQSVIHLLKFIDTEGLEDQQRIYFDSIKQTPILRRLTEQLHVYFTGSDEPVEIPTARAGSQFSQQVFNAIEAIPYGQVQSYSNIATSISKPKATRAVASAANKNWLAIIIPSHRVVGANGKPVGFGAGLGRQKWLIEHEQRQINKSSF
jgi:AraC family transcriptional regulator, regulatory protein of adaptative response / methylated-DNA-[protein]-cysteine methyltransferase